MTDAIPYERATSGDSARGEIARLLQKFGAGRVGFMDSFEDRSVLLQFEYRGRQVSLRASANGWAALYLRAHPWNNRRRYSEAEWRQRAVSQGMIAVSSILRDWVKGQLMAVETGIASFDQVFLPYMLTSAGRPLYEHVLKNREAFLLPAPDENAE